MKAYTSNGWLTPYGLSMGYIHKQGDIVLKQAGQGFMVVGGLGVNPHGWETMGGGYPFKMFHRIGEARAAFRGLCGGLARHYEAELNAFVID